MVNDLIKKIFFTKFSVIKSEKLEEELKTLKALKEKEEEEKKNFFKVFQELKEKKEETERSKRALLNILEDITESEKIVRTQKKILDDTINYFIHGIILFGKNEEILLINQKIFEIFNIKEIDIKEENYQKLKEDKNYLEILNFLRQKDLKEIEISFNRYHFKIDKVVFETSGEIDCLIILNDITRDIEIQQAQSDFVALTAHQLRTPLSGIKWTLEMFLDGTFGEFNQEQKEYIRQLSDNSARLIKVVNRFLDVAQIEQGRFVEKREVFDIVDVIDKNIKEINPFIKEKEIDLSFVFAKNIITRVDGDREKIKIVIQNLLENALKYTPKRGKIKIALQNSENNLIFSIKDNGYGISIEEQEKIFTKFFRGSNIKRVDTEGSGLGLFVIKNIIEAHHGNIWFKSQGKDKGTTFYFTLTIAR